MKRPLPRVGNVCPWVVFSGTILGHAVPRCSILEPFHPFLRLPAFLLARAAAEKGFFKRWDGAFLVQRASGRGGEKALGNREGTS